MSIKACIPVIPSFDLKKSLRFWVEALGLTMDREMSIDGKLVGCMVHDEEHYFWLNRRAGTIIAPEDFYGISLYWTPAYLRRRHGDVEIKKRAPIGCSYYCLRATTPDRTCPGSSPYSRPLRSLSRTPASSRHRHRLPRLPEAGSSNRRPGQHGFRSI